MGSSSNVVLPRRPASVTRVSTIPLAALLLLTLCLTAARAATVMLTSVADSELREFSPDSNFGFSTSMVSGELGLLAHNEIRRAVLRFDLSGQIPSNAVINSVTLNVVVVKLPLSPANSNFDLRRLLAPWDEGTVTWNSRSSGVPWQVPGATGTADSVATASSTVFVTGFGTYTFPSTTPLVADVQNWANNPGTNFGWLLVSEAESTPFTARHFGTREDPINAPTLIVNYSVSNRGPPTVALTLSPPRTNFALGTPITNTATVVSAGTQVTNVEFFTNATLLGQVATPPFSLVWTPLATNVYSLEAVALDDLGQTGTSAPVTIHILPPDAIPPRVTITGSLPNFARTNSPQVLLTGTASDNQGVAFVEVQLNDGPFQQATGTTSWSTNLVLPAGTSTVRARSVDLLGNVSLAATRFFTFVVKTNLKVQVSGAGTVVSNLNWSALEIGKIYSLTAQPGPGQMLAFWEAAGQTNRLVPKNSLVLNFVMKPDLRLVAYFVPNPFPQFVGSYSGLFLDTNNVTPEGSGIVTLQLDQRGAFSGKLGMNRANYPFSGLFNYLTNATLAVIRHALRPSLLALRLEQERGTELLVGSVTNTVGTNLISSEVRAQRKVFDGLTHIAPQTGRWPFALQQLPAAGGQIVGTGAANVNLNGAVQISGSLNGQKFGVGSTVFADGNIPFYVPLGSGTEVVIGWMNITRQPSMPVTGTLYWTKSGANGFSTQLEVVSPAP